MIGIFGRMGARLARAAGLAAAVAGMALTLEDCTVHAIQIAIFCNSRPIGCLNT